MLRIIQIEKILIIFILLFSFVARVEAVSAADNSLPEKIFSAEVIKIIKEQDAKMSDGGIVKQQDLEIKGVEGKYESRTIEIIGIGDPESAVKNIYEVGDKVSVAESFDEKGNARYFIMDYVRTNSIKWLAIAFAVSLLVIGRWKGLRSLISLILTFVVIMEYILPQIMDGSDPVIVTLIGSCLILLMIIYITEGFKTSGHIAIVSIFFSLIATIGISWLFVNLARLTGLANEEASFLVGYGGQIVNFKGLLLAGIIIGALGVLDDVVISQISAVEELNKASNSMTKMELFRSAYKVGISHISSMTNTLFLAYAGASLPLLILFLSGQSAFSTTGQALNNESLATEIVRTLAGSIGLILAVPISTILAVWWYKRK